MASRTELIDGQLRVDLEPRHPQAPRATIIGDREWLNTEAIINHGNQYPNALELGGIIAPGGEFDNRIFSLADSVKDMRRHGHAFPFPEEGGTDGFYFTSPQAEFVFQHAPYDPKILRSEPSYRKAYCQDLVKKVALTNPDLIFLSNFKVYLDPVFVEAFKGKIVNVHPSILPLLKGYRTEFRADTGETPQASGYTIHLVDVDLDGGPTVFAQYVLLDPIDPSQIENKAYMKEREERHRLKVIMAQARYTPQVLALIASNTTRKTVTDQEAFAYECREGFEESTEYFESLGKDFEEWQKKHPQGPVSYEEWHAQYRKPYQRVLFDVGNGWQIAEDILRANQLSDIETPDIITEYTFCIPGDNPTAVARYMEIRCLAETVREARGGGHFDDSFQYYGATENNPQSMLLAKLCMPYDITEQLDNLGITYQKKTMPTNVLTPRVPIMFGHDQT